MLVILLKASSWSSIGTVAPEEEDVEAGRGPLVELASPDKSPRRARGSTGPAGARRGPAASETEAWLASFPPSKLVTGGEDELLIVSGVP